VNNLAIRASNFINSIGINTHLNYTDGAYANTANVEADLAYLGITTVRDAVPNPAGGIPYYNQTTAIETLAATGIKFDFVSQPGTVSIATTVQELEAFNAAFPGSAIAIEGANEINNWPVTYAGQTGQAGAAAFQAALDTAIKGTPSLSGVAVYDFTGGNYPVELSSGTMTRNVSGSYTLVNGQMAWQVALPTGVSTITLTYTGTNPGSVGSGIFASAGAGQKSNITYGSNGKISYTFNNTGGAVENLAVDVSDWGHTATITSVSATGPGSSTNLVNFDPSLSLAGQADDADVHIYPYTGGAVGPLISGAYQSAFGSAVPGPRVITETGFETDPNDPNGVTQTVQAQQDVNALLEAYQAGVSTTYLYELLDEKADPSNTNAQLHFGVFNNNNTPKLAAVALHNLTGLLADAGGTASTFTTGTLNYTSTGTNAGDQSMLIEKSTGEFDIALWNDGFAGKTTTDSVTVNLGASFANVVVNDLVTGSQTACTNVTQLTVALGGDPMIVQILPASLSNAAKMNIVTPAATTTTTKTTTAAILAAAAPATNTTAAGAFTTTTTTTSSATVSGLLASTTTQQSHTAALVTTTTHHLHVQ
jgi:hypothetical protein